jgi:hypothetical protein
MREPTSNVEYVEKALHSERVHAPALWIEVVEALLLALVALTTAWSGFEAAKWSGDSTEQMSNALRTTVLAQLKATLAGQDRLNDVFVFNDWLRAKAEHNEELADFYKRRFRPEYTVFFDEWLKLDPLHNPSAPPGPSFMKNYTNENAREAAQLDDKATVYVEAGERMRHASDEYVRVTVFLATVLLLMAIGQRLRTPGLRKIVAVGACILFFASAAFLLTLPHSW